jgi:hypothetical protein
VFGKAEQSQDVSFFIELTISGAIICPLIVGRIAMRPYEKKEDLGESRLDCTG